MRTLLPIILSILSVTTSSQLFGPSEVPSKSFVLPLSRVKSNSSRPWVHPFYRNSDKIPESMTKKKLLKPNYNWSMYNVDDIMYTADIYMGSNH
jgi:hypothetical protein